MHPKVCVSSSSFRRVSRGYVKKGESMVLVDIVVGAFMMTARRTSLLDRTEWVCSDVHISEHSPVFIKTVLQVWQWLNNRQIVLPSCCLFEWISSAFHWANLLRNFWNHCIHMYYRWWLPSTYIHWRWIGWHHRTPVICQQSIIADAWMAITLLLSCFR